MYGLVIPVFNEEKRLDIQYFLKISEIPNLEMLFVDDGSTDATVDILTSLVSLKSNISILELVENVGKSEAVRAGLNGLMQDLKFDAVGFIDSDGAFGVEDVSNLISYMTDVAPSGQNWWWTSRVKLPENEVERSRIRHIIGRIISSFLGLGFKGLPYDTQSGLKFFSINSYLAIFLSEPFKTRWFFEIELLIRAKNFFNVAELIVMVPVLNWHEVKGSKLKFRHCISITKELLYIKSLQYGYRKKYASI
jgi:glycosyltransferase involved in cell wall biosynthesis